ncbi:bifunctional DNA primase/polymerase [uncultured Gimesia sp.]|uniref:bifunctional DNA primase/polymerase n=1 Tax=uncultured Gimesia sp. TaxID=1678688 RepID=UPI0026328BD1|nr:bifunctional DNA primase/polymerase [uncultured Gimesia sp.]
MNQVVHNINLQAALEYAGKGIKVFPCVPGDKKPLGSLAPHGCKDATTDEEIIVTWWEAEPTANIGLSTDGLLVVDIDGHNNEWLTNSEKLSGLSDGAISETPSGGRHYVFLGDEELRNTTGTLARNVDTRANGGYIVAAPSVVNGKPYKWLDGCELDSRDNLATVPDWIIEKLDTTNKAPVKLEGNTIPHGVQQDTLIRIAGSLRRIGLSFNEINASLQLINLQRCEKPGTEKAIEDIARSAARYDPDQVSVAFIEDHYSQLQLEDPEERLTFISAKEFNEGDYSTEFLINGVLTRGQPCIMAAQKKCLKTNIAIDMAVSLATGTHFLGKFPVPIPVNTAVVSCESGEPTLQETFRRVTKSKNLLPSNVENLHFCFDTPSLQNAIDVNFIRQTIEELEIEVLFIDPVYLCMSLGDSASNLFSVGEKLKPLSNLVQETGCTIILIHHTRKTRDGKDWNEPQLEEIAFAGFQEFARQWVLLGRRDAYKPDIPGHHKLHFVAGGSAGHSQAWALDINEGSIDDPGGRIWDVRLFPAQEARAEKQTAKEKRKKEQNEAQFEEDMRKVAEELQSFDVPVTATKVRDNTNLTTPRTNSALARLVKMGKVTSEELKAKNGRHYDHYTLVSDTAGTAGSNGNEQCLPASRSTQSSKGNGTPYKGYLPVTVFDHDGTSLKQDDCQKSLPVDLNEAFPTDSESEYF